MVQVEKWFRNQNKEKGARKMEDGSWKKELDEGVGRKDRPYKTVDFPEVQLNRIAVYKKR